MVYSLVAIIVSEEKYSQLSVLIQQSHSWQCRWKLPLLRIRCTYFKILCSLV